MSENDKPNPLKPVVWDKDSGTVTWVDQMDWRIEGTAANKRVEYLLGKTTLWQAVTAVVLVPLVIGTAALLVVDPGPRFDAWFWSLTTGLAIATACYARSEVLRIKLKVWTRGE
jgi:hypothetical protein